ncbi:hypothetical protein [Devosia sp. A369]
MSFTRKTLADAIDAYDADIEILQQSKRETFADYREQLAGEGRDKDMVKDEIAAFKAAMKRRRAVAKEGSEAVEDQVALVDVIFDEITAARATRATREENIDEFPADEDDSASVNKRIAALKANPALAIVDVANLKKSEPQPAPQAGSDLTSPPSSQGQVATNQPETATIQAASGSADVPKVATDKPAEPSGSAAPAALYAEPGIVVWEDHPPEGVERHEYSMAFGTLGQDIAVIEDDLVGAKAEPIVKMGKVILDGWARYMKARALGIEYPVIQYGGDDPMGDCIRWNLAGRILNDDQKRVIAQRMVKLYPQRKGPIFAEFGLGMELA